MTLGCASRTPSAYESGRLAPGDARLFRPGGLEMTMHGIALAQIGTGSRILDLGCGAGDTVRYLRSAGFDAIGVDYTFGSATAEGTPTRILACAESLPLADRSAHAVLAECSVSLLNNREQALTECARVLIDGGAMIISDLYARRPEAIGELGMLRGSCVAGVLVREELEASLANAGFTVDVWEDHSRALRECAARYLFEHGSINGLWGCGDSSSSKAIEAAMRAARAGYFLLIATRRPRCGPKGDQGHE